MWKLTSGILAALLALGVAHSSRAQTEKPASSDAPGPQRQTNASEKQSRSSASIKGKVIAEGGRPVSEASILVFPVNISNNMSAAVTSLLRPITSDADGRFELTSLRPGAYTVSASSPGFVLSEQDSKAFYRPGDTVTLTLVKGGVITGRVTDSSGNPVVGAAVRAVKVRDTDDKPPRARGGILSQITESLEAFLGPYKTDDRGIYRIYGLSPGYYQVAAGGRGGQGFSLGGANAYDGDAPTYYPSSTLDTAAEVSVPAGEEATNIDIRYRENRGHSVGGTVSVSAGPTLPAISVLLTRANSGIVEATTVVLAGRNRFGFDSLLDGEYLVTAMGSSGNLTSSEGLTASVSQPRRITVRGADVSGVDLVLEPLGSIAGRAMIETLQDPKQKAECKDVRTSPVEGTVLSARDERKQTSVDPMRDSLSGLKNATPNEKGEFLIGMLRPGVQRVDVQLPGEHLYLKRITLTQPDPNAKPIDVAKNGVQLKSGEKLKGLVVSLSEGAAGLRGKVVTGDDKVPDVRIRVHLVPVEPEAADDVLRYFESEARNDGSFSFSNLTPGKYWLLTREISEQEKAEDAADHKPVAWDAGGRTGLRFEGEASKKIIDLSQCQRVTDFVIRYIPLASPSKPPAKKPIQ